MPPIGILPVLPSRPILKMDMQEQSRVMKRTFRVTAVWDEDAKVYVAESDIIGLHIEAATVDEFEDVLMDVAPELIVANHMTSDDIAGKPYRDLVPAILWTRPPERHAA